MEDNRTCIYGISRLLKAVDEETNARGITRGEVRASKGRFSFA